MGMTEMTPRSRWLALYVPCAGALMIVLDATIVNVALPTIQDDLHFSQSGLAWGVNAYLIAFGGLLLLAGRLGDLIGQRKVVLLGLGIFTGASLLCALATSQGLLIGARFVQGVGGALSSAVVLGMIVTMFAGPRRRAELRGRPRDDRDDVRRAARAGQGDRGLRVRRLGRRLDRPAGRRRAH